MQTTTSDLVGTNQFASHGKRNLTPLADNAFRLLGLSCHATQKEIYASASGIRRALKLGVEPPPPPHHLAWLGSLERTENSVRDALSRLADPARRIHERFFWFFEPQHISTELSFAATEESAARLRAASQPSTRHDIALLSLAVLLQLDTGLFLADEWRRTYALWKELIEAREFWSLLVASDLKGDFEQVTTFGEVGDLRVRVWRLVTSPVAELAKDGILRDDPALTRRALAILRRSELPQTLADEYENEILAPVEDEFELLFAEAFRSFRYDVKSNQNVGERRASCQRMLAGFDAEVRPALKKIFELAGAQSPVTRRVCEVAADGLEELADGFESAYERAWRLRTLRRAWQLAPPESATLLLIEEHLRAAGDEQERAAKTDSDYARQLLLALRQPLPQPELFTSYIQKEEAAKTFEGRGQWASKIVLMLLFAVMIGKCVHNLPGSRRTSALPPINFNVAMPKSSPQLPPKFQPEKLIFHLTPRQLEVKVILKSALVVDVRAKNEYDAGHVEGAISIPAAEVAARAKRWRKNKQIVFYGSDAEPAEPAALELQALGYTDVAVLEGGYRAWRDAGLSVKQNRKGLVQKGREN
jgi:rhodanese-related sulfurtransferase